MTHQEKQPGTHANESSARTGASQDFNLTSAFEQLQSGLLTSHASIRAVTRHPGTKGDHSEDDWARMLRSFLPARYSVGPIFAVDSRGYSSDQIDVAVYDKQYSPMWFGANQGAEFVPVESVYAAFEVKPTLDVGNLIYAQDKVASVRRLHRTSAVIKYAGGVFGATSPADKHIIGGVLTATAGWATYEGSVAKLREHLCEPGLEGSLDLGVALDTVAFDYTPSPVAGQADEPQAPLTFSAEGKSLSHFAIRLFDQLQRLGTVLALDIREYERGAR